MEPLRALNSNARLPALSAIVRLGWERLKLTNIQTNFDSELITAVKNLYDRSKMSPC